MLENLKKVFRSKSWIIWALVWFTLIFWISYSYTDFGLLVWNYGYAFAYGNLFLDICVALLFWTFAWASLYKIIKFSDFSKKSTLIWTTWAFFGILISGCPSCTITIASQLSIATIFTGTFTFYGTEVKIFPFNGLELKVLSIFLLWFALKNIINELETCRLK